MFFFTLLQHVICNFKKATSWCCSALWCPFIGLLFCFKLVLFASSTFDKLHIMELADPLHFNSSTCWGSKVNFFKDFTGLKLLLSISCGSRERSQCLMDSHRYLWPLASISGMNMLAYGFNLLLISVHVYLVCTHAPCGITTHFYRLLLSGWIEWSGLSSSCPPGLEGGAWSHGWGGRGPCCRSQSWCWCSSWAELGACPRPPHYQTSSDRLQPTFLCTREAKVRNTNSTYRRTCFKSVSSSLLIWHKQKQYQLLTNYAVFIFCQNNNISYHCISRLYSSAHAVAFPSKLKLFTRRFVVSHKEKTKNHEHWD